MKLNIIILGAIASLLISILKIWLGFDNQSSAMVMDGAQWFFISTIALTVSAFVKRFF